MRRDSYADSVEIKNKYKDMFFYYVHDVDILTFFTIELVSDGTDFFLH